MTLSSATPPIPLGSQRLLESEAPPKLQELYHLLQQGVRRPAAISRIRRVGITLAASIFPATGLLIGAGLVMLQQGVRNENPEVIKLSSLTLAVQLSSSDEERQDLRRFIAHEYRELIENPETWNDAKTTMMIDMHRQRIARDAVKEFDALSPEEIAAATKAAEPYLKQEFGVFPEVPIAPLVLMFVLLSWFVYAALPSILAALACRRGVIMLMFGANVVNREGKRASRLQCLGRSLLAWMPVLGGQRRGGRPLSTAWPGSHHRRCAGRDPRANDLLLPAPRPIAAGPDCRDLAGPEVGERAANDVSELGVM